jgi:hypothetical protein
MEHVKALLARIEALEAHGLPVACCSARCLSSWVKLAAFFRDAVCLRPERLAQRDAFCRNVAPLRCSMRDETLARPLCKPL